MAALRNGWDPPYRSHHQQLVQPRRSPEDLPGQRRSRGVLPYDSPQPPHLRGMPSRLEMPQQTYRQTPHYTGMGRYEQLFDQLDVAISRLESRCDKIERRVTNLPASKATYAHQARYDSRREIRTRPTCWDPPSRTHGRRVEEIRAPPLPEPPPQYTPTPSQHLLLVQSRRSTYWDPPGQRQSRGIPTHDQPYGVPPYEQPRSPPDVYTGQQRDCQQPQRRNQHFTFPSSHTPPQPQLVLDQQPPPSHRCSAAPPLAAAASPPPLRSVLPLMQPSTTSTIELPPYTTPRPCQPLLPLSVIAPLSASTHQLQGDVSSSRKEELAKDLHDSEEKREAKLIVLNNVGNQKEIEKENDSNAKREEEVNNTFHKLVEKEIRPEALGSSLETKEKDLRPERRQSTIEKMEILCLVEDGKTAFESQKHDLEGKMEDRKGLFENEIRVTTEKLVTKKTTISNTMKILKKRGQSCAFDPGGTLRRVVVSTLRTRWILTVGELIRSYLL